MKFGVIGERSRTLAKINSCSQSADTPFHARSTCQGFSPLRYENHCDTLICTETLLSFSLSLTAIETEPE